MRRSDDVQRIYRTYKPSSLERKAMKILDSLGIPYIFQYSTRTDFIIDFAIFLDDKKIALEIDGPHHSDYRRKRKDRIKDLMLKREGWKVLRVSYNKIYNLRNLLLCY